MTWADEIIVLDSKSTDKTRQIAKKYATKVLLHDFRDYASQKQAAIDACSSRWILEVDADEVVPEALRKEIQQLQEHPEKMNLYAAYIITRQEYFLKKPLMISKIPRLYKKQSVHYTGEIHERLAITGAVGSLQHPLLHESDTYETIADRITKINAYTKKESELIFLKNPGIFGTLFKMLTVPILYFTWQYIFQRLVFKGYRGLIWSLLTAYYHFLIYAKVYEYIYKQKHFSQHDHP